jgi:hypothetical protein
MKKIMSIILVVAVACSSAKIKGVEKTDDFLIAKYKTFSFYEVSSGGDALGPNYQNNLKLLNEAITNEMKAKGVTLTGDNPDLLVNIGVVVSEEIQTRETDFANPADRTAYVGQRNYTWTSSEVEVGKYREGTVTIHLVDRVANKLVWKGSAESVLPEKQKNVPVLIEDSMKLLFEKIK